jgi:hypothetical protein
MDHNNKIKVKLTDNNLKQNQQEINKYLSYLKKNKTLKQKLASNPTEDDIEKLLDPLDIDDIVIRPTNNQWIHFSYNYNNIDFAYEQNLLESQGRLQASIRAFHNKSKAYLNVDNSILSISSDSNISITLKQGSPCSLNNIAQLTEQLEEDIYDTLDNLGLIAY